MSITMTLQTTDVESASKCPICNQEIVGISASRPGEHYYTCGHEATNHILSEVVQIPHETGPLEGTIWELLTGIPAEIILNDKL